MFGRTRERAKVIHMQVWEWIWCFQMVLISRRDAYSMFLGSSPINYTWTLNSQASFKSKAQVEKWRSAPLSSTSTETFLHFPPRADKQTHHTTGAEVGAPISLAAEPQLMDTNIPIVPVHFGEALGVLRDRPDVQTNILNHVTVY